jgi:hypothetical protein
MGSGVLTCFEVEVEIVRTGAATQRMIQRGMFYNAAAGTGAPYITAAVTPAETLSGNVDLTFKLQTSGTRVLVGQGYTVEFLPAVA